MRSARAKPRPINAARDVGVVTLKSTIYYRYRIAITETAIIITSIRSGPSKKGVREAGRDGTIGLIGLEARA